MIVYAARHLLPVVSPPVEDGAVAVGDGRIAHCGPRSEVLAAVGGDAELRDVGEAALLPGLVNAHAHVELSWARDEPLPEGDYIGWLRGLLERRAEIDPETARQAAETAIGGMIDRGTVAVGDVSNDSWVVSLLAASELSGVAFHEVYGFKSDDAERLIEEATRRIESIAAEPAVLAAKDRWRVVMTPHAPHTTSAPLLRALGGRSAATGEPLSIHVAESKAEAQLLRDGGGPLPELYRDRGVWDDAWIAPGHTPVEHLDRLGLLSERTLAVHCVHLLGRDHSMLQTRGVRVITCPRSNRRLGVGLAQVPRLLGEGVPVALGTDSLASAPDLDLFAEIAALRRDHPGIAPAAALRMATLNGAVALGLGDDLGGIAVGRRDRLVVVPLAEGDDPLEAVCSEPDEVHWLEQAPWESPS